MASSSRQKRKRKAATRPSTGPAPQATDSAPDPKTPGPARGPVAPGRTREMPSGPSVDLVREQVRGRIAGLCAIAILVLTIGAVPVAASGPKIHAPSGSAKSLLLAAVRAGSAQESAMWMRFAAALLLIPVALFLYSAVHGRKPSYSRWIPVLGIIGVVIVAASLVVGFYETRDAAHTFADSGAQTVARAKHVLNHQTDLGPLRASDIGNVVGPICFGLWVAITSYEMMQVGLHTRFLGIFGVAAGLCSCLPVGVGPPLFAAWIGSTGVLALGYWPGGSRPPAWDEGRAVSLSEADARDDSRSRRATMRG